MAIITPDDLETVMNVEFDSSHWDQAVEVIADVQGELEEYLQRPVEVIAVEGEEHEIGYDESRIYLKNTPVVSVDQVSVNGQVFTVPTWQTTRWGLDMGATTALAMLDPVIWTPSAWAYSSAPPDVYALASGTIPRTVYSINYHGGLDGPNIRGIKSILTRAVRRELAGLGEGLFGAGDYTRVSVEDYSVQKNERLMLQKVGSFMAGELKSISHLRKKGSIAV